METFNQILELDEDETRDFSSEMVWSYFTQAGTTFLDMDSALCVRPRSDAGHSADRPQQSEGHA